jgi:hypothetical protein
MQFLIDANTRLTVAVDTPTPSARNDYRAYRNSGVDQQCGGAHEMSDGGYRGDPGVIMPHRKPDNGSSFRRGPRN